MFTWTSSLGIPKIPRSKLTSKLASKYNTTNMEIAVGKVKIGSGQYGNVNMFYLNNRMKNRVAVKTQTESMVTEIALMKKIGKFSTVPRVLKGPDRSKLYSEFIPGNSLFDFFTERKGYITDDYASMFVIQVARQLQKIHTRDPSFRHNDLHTGNILVHDDVNKGWNINETGTKLYITDFGLARDSQFHNPIFEDGSDPEYKNSLREDYGIYVGNHHMYDMAVFLLSFKKTITKAKFPQTYARILYVTRGLKTKNNRPQPGEDMKHSFRDIIKIFGGTTKNKISPVKSPRLNTIFQSPRVNLMNFKRGKTMTNLAKINLNTYMRMLPNSMNKNKKIEYIVKTLKFKPRQLKKTPQKLQSFFSPQKLKNRATLGASRFKNKQIKRTSPMKMKSPVKRPSPFRLVLKGSPSKRPSQFKRKIPVSSPFNNRKFNNANYKTLRPVNIERYFNSKGRLSNAKSFIETIVRTKRTEAWEKAKQLLANEVKVTRR